MERKRVLAVLFVTSLMLMGSIASAQCGPYRPYNQFMQAFMNLANSYPGVITTESVGKSVEGTDIMLFKIGNPQSERILFDGAIHGWESLAGETLYYYAEWLVSNDSEMAKTILANTYTLIIPAVNPDEYNIQRQNAHGVDLNRNFSPGWESGTNDTTSMYYRGPSALSEPESQTIAKVLQTYDPGFYVNMHAGDGTELYGTSYGNASTYASLFQQIDSASKAANVAPYTNQIVGAPGEAMSYAATLGITSFVLELGSQTTPLAALETVVFPQFLPVAVTLSSKTVPPNNRILFSDDFESGNLNAWDGVHLSSGATANVTTILPREGQYSALFTLNSSSQNQRADCYKTLQPCSEITAGALFLVNSSGTTTNDGFLYFIMLIAGNNPVAYGGWSHSQGAVHWRLKIQNGTGWTYVDSSSSPARNHWYNTELYWREDATIGTGQLIVDGVSVCQIISKNTATYGSVDSVCFGLPATYDSGSTKLFCDNVQVSRRNTYSSTPWDINHDGKVDLHDFVILANAYGSHCANYDYQGEPASPSWNPNADINGDGIVNLQDLITLSLHYGQQYS